MHHASDAKIEQQLSTAPGVLGLGSTVEIAEPKCTTSAVIESADDDETLASGMLTTKPAC
jgi:hypothetical protein